jgi:hypothetical protein
VIDGVLMVISHCSVTDGRSCARTCRSLDLPFHLFMGTLYREQAHGYKFELSALLSQFPPDHHHRSSLSSSSSSPLLVRHHRRCKLLFSTTRSVSLYNIIKLTTDAQVKRPWDEPKTLRSARGMTGSRVLPGGRVATD